MSSGFINPSAGGLLRANNLSDLANAQTALDNLTNAAAVTSLKLRSTATGGIRIFNTVDQTTNFERLNIFWNANVATISTEFAGGGSGRTLLLSTPSGASISMPAGPSTGGSHRFTGFSNSLASAVGYLFAGYTFTATSGNTVALSLTPTYNQVASTAANTDLLVNRTETAIGSGVQRLIDLQVNGVSQFRVGNDGQGYLIGQFTCAGPILSNYGTGGIGYLTGAGGSVAQGAGKNSAVTLNKVTGEITMDGANLNGGTIVSFVLTNSAIAATDHVLVQHVAVGTLGGYGFAAVPAAGSATIYVRNNTGGPLAEAIKIKVTVIKAVIN